MARIRTIKPEFWTSVQVADCSPTSRLLFVGLWSFADDAGIHPACCRRVKIQIFPADQCSTDDIQGWIDELIAADLLIEYLADDGQTYWQVTGWAHQKIDKPRYKYPKPSDESAIIRRTVGDESSNGSRPFDTRTLPDTTEQEENRKTYSSESAVAAAELTAYEFPTVGKDGKTWTLPRQLFDELAQAYPDLDHAEQFRKARTWLVTNPKRRKTARGMPKFLNGWLERAQNSNHKPSTAPQFADDDIRGYQQ